MMKPDILSIHQVYQDNFEFQLNVTSIIFLLQFCDNLHMLLLRHMKTSNKRKRIVKQHNIRSLRMKYYIVIKEHREDRGLCVQMKPMYTVCA
jgi:hypothetical protein